MMQDVGAMRVGTYVSGVDRRTLEIERKGRKETSSFFFFMLPSHLLGSLSTACSLSPERSPIHRLARS